MQLPPGRSQQAGPHGPGAGVAFAGVGAILQGLEQRGLLRQGKRVDAREKERAVRGRLKKANLSGLLRGGSCAEKFP